MHKEEYRISKILNIFKFRLKWLSRKLILILAAIMIGFSNVICEDDAMVNIFKDQTEQQMEKEED